MSLIFKLTKKKIYRAVFFPMDEEWIVFDTAYYNTIEGSFNSLIEADIFIDELNKKNNDRKEK